MLPAYDPKSFKDVDLRRYHVRDVKDCIQFIVFVSSRLEEMQHVLNKFNTKHNTLQAVVKQMQVQQQKISDLYGDPNQKALESSQEPAEGIAKIETVQQPSHNDEERQSLLDELRQASANEQLAAKAVDKNGNLLTDVLKAEFEKYKLTRKPNRDFYYREGKLIKEADVPEDIKRALIDALEV